MEKTFRRYRDRPGARHAFAEAEAITYLAHQILVLRTQRGWTQAELARRIGSTQAAVSRLEDPSYGRFNIKTLMVLARAFDVAPVFKFSSIVDLMAERWVVRPSAMEVLPFETEAAEVGFYEPATPLSLPSIVMRVSGSHSFDTSITVLPTDVLIEPVTVDMAAA